MDVGLLQPADQRDGRKGAAERDDGHAPKRRKNAMTTTPNGGDKIMRFFSAVGVTIASAILIGAASFMISSSAWMARMEEKVGVITHMESMLRALVNTVNDVDARLKVIEDREHRRNP